MGLCTNDHPRMCLSHALRNAGHPECKDEAMGRQDLVHAPNEGAYSITSQPHQLGAARLPYSSSRRSRIQYSFRIVDAFSTSFLSPGFTNGPRPLLCLPKSASTFCLAFRLQIGCQHVDGVLCLHLETLL
jgi:hypothetical protein